MIKLDYYSAARENEPVFRNILRDLKANASNRPGGCYIPTDLETEAPLEQLFERYSQGQRIGQFTILNFSRPSNATARFSFQDVAPLSGGGAELEYKVAEDSSVKFEKSASAWMS